LRDPLPHLHAIGDLIAREVRDVEGRKLLAGDDRVEVVPSIFTAAGSTQYTGNWSSTL